jgi:hypothetical protein
VTSVSRAAVRRRIAVLLCLAATALPGARPVDAQVVTAGEDELKAAFLYNFVRFVEWPERAFAGPGDPLVVCLEDGEFAAVVARSVADKKVGERDLVVRPWSGAPRYEGCHVVFLDHLERDAWDDVFASLASHSVLTVGDMRRFASEGGIINFTRAGDKLRFEINPAAAERADLKISSKLLRVAEVIGEGTH